MSENWGVLGRRGISVVWVINRSNKLFGGWMKQGIILFSENVFHTKLGF